MIRPPLRVANVALLGLTLVGCSDLGQPLVLASRGELSASSIDFGSVLVAQSVTRYLTIRNTGNAKLKGTASLSCANFVIVSGGGAFTVAPGASREVVLRFQPAAQGAFACTLDLGPDLPAVPLAGSGAFQAPGSAFSVSVSTIDFGAVATGQSVFRVFTISSVGTAPLLVNVVSSCSDFLPIQGGGQRTLAPGDSIVVSVLFNPLSGGFFNCAIATGPGGPDIRATGQGTTVSLSRDVAPVILTYSNGCIDCHVFGTPVLFELSSIPLDRLVNVESGYSWASSEPAVRVKPFQPDSSVLYLKLVGDGRFGSQMPASRARLSDSDLAKIRTWILEGAHEN